MSTWTHIFAVIEVNTHEKADNLIDFVNNKIKSAPVISGTDGNADIFINQKSGYSTSCIDCESCTFNTNDEHCRRPKNFICPEKNYQMHVVITVLGHLSDRTKCYTEKEYEDFINFLKTDCDFSILNQFQIIKGW